MPADMASICDSLSDITYPECSSDNISTQCEDMCKITAKRMKSIKLCKVYGVPFFFFNFFFPPFLRPPLNFCLLNEDLGNASAESAFPEQRSLLLLMHLSNLKLIPACTEQQIDPDVDEANPAALKSKLY